MCAMNLYAKLVFSYEQKAFMCAFLITLENFCSFDTVPVILFKGFYTIIEDFVLKNCNSAKTHLYLFYKMF